MGRLQLHLNFAAFILGVPIFVVIVEFAGCRNRGLRSDWLTRNCMKLTFGAYSAAALLGGALLFLFNSVLAGLCPVLAASTRCGHRHGARLKLFGRRVRAGE